MELPAKLLEYFLRSNQSNINQNHNNHQDMVEPKFVEALSRA